MSLQALSAISAWHAPNLGPCFSRSLAAVERALPAWHAWIGIRGRSVTLHARLNHPRRAPSLAHRNVINLELMDQPPAERAASNRWPFWPRVFRIDYGHAEAKHAYGADPRRYCVLSKRFIKGDDGRVTVSLCTDMLGHLIASWQCTCMMKVSLGPLTLL